MTADCLPSFTDESVCYTPKPARWQLVGSELVASVARDFGLTLAEIKGQCRFSVFLEARATVTHILRERGVSFPRIARTLGRADHTTVINMDRKFARYALRNPMVISSYERHSQIIMADDNDEPSDDKSSLSGADLVRSVAKDFGITLEQVRGNCQTKVAVAARATVIRIMRGRGRSYTQIAMTLGGRNRATITNSDRRFDLYASNNPMVMRSYSRHTR